MSEAKVEEYLKIVRDLDQQLDVRLLHLVFAIEEQGRIIRALRETVDDLPVSEVPITKEELEVGE